MPRSNGKRFDNKAAARDWRLAIALTILTGG
jgi:hypothetical protein